MSTGGWKTATTQGCAGLSGEVFRREGPALGAPPSHQVREVGDDDEGGIVGFHLSF